MKKIILISSLVFLVSCSSDPFNPRSYPDNGLMTLLVIYFTMLPVFNLIMIFSALKKSGELRLKHVAEEEDLESLKEKHSSEIESLKQDITNLKKEVDQVKTDYLNVDDYEYLNDELKIKITKQLESLKEKQDKKILTLSERIKGLPARVKKLESKHETKVKQIKSLQEKIKSK